MNASVSSEKEKVKESQSRRVTPSLDTPSGARLGASQGKPVLVPPCRNSPVVKWYRYHTNWYWYQHVIFAGFEKNSNSSSRVRSSFDHKFEITMEKGIKAKGRVERSSFGF